MDPNENQQQNNTPNDEQGDAPGQRQQDKEREQAQQEQSTFLRPLRTYKDDVQRALGEGGDGGGVGVIDIAAAEQERRAKRRTLSDRELKLQEEIEREGAHIRTLSSQIEAGDGAQKPDDLLRQYRVPEKKPDELKPPPPAPPRPKEYMPPPGVAPQAPPQKRVLPPPPKKPAPAPPKQPPRIDRSRELAELRAAEKRLAEAETRLQQTKHERATITPVKLRPKRARTVSLGRPLMIIGVSIVLLGAAGGIGWYVYNNFATIGTVAPEEQIPTAVPTNTAIEVVHTSNDRLISTLDQRMDGISASMGELVQLYVTAEAGNKAALLSGSEFLSQLAPAAPGRLVRSLSDTYTFGVHVRERPEPFLIARTTFFENAFAGMLDWETTMSDNLDPLFGPRVVSTRTGETTAEVTSVRFVDRVVQNKDTRILYDQNNDVALIYSFIDRETVVLTTNLDTFVDVVNRLSGARVVR